MKYLIIGASSGLGKELAKKFAEERNDLVIISRDIRDLNAIKSDLEMKHSINIDVLALDFSSLDEIDNKLFSNQKLLENLDGVLFPIGMMFKEDNLNLKTENLKKLINANFISIAHTIQKLKENLIKKKIHVLLVLVLFQGFLEEELTLLTQEQKEGWSHILKVWLLTKT